MNTTTENHDAAQEKSEGIFAGVMHRNSLDLVKRGPWHVTNVNCRKMGSEVRVTMADGVDFITTHGGTCDCCGMPIANIVTLHSAIGERITLGLDCAKTLERNGGLESAACSRALAKAEDKIRKARNARATTRRHEREASAKASAVANAETAFASDLAKCDRLVAASGEGSFAWSFARDIARRIRKGDQLQPLSARQTALLDRLVAEVSEAS